MLKDGMQGSNLASRTYLKWDDGCTEFVQLLIKTNQWQPLIKSGGQRPQICYLPFGSQEGPEVKLPTSAKNAGVKEPPEKSLEELGAIQQHGEVVEGE